MRSEKLLNTLLKLSPTLAAKPVPAKAFRGKLVPQKPNDAPTSELLKRIQAEREQQTKNTLKRKATRRKTAKYAKRRNSE